MKYVIVYWSRYGNGRKIVNYLAEKLSNKGEVKVFKTNEVNPSSMPEADLHIFSAPTEIFNIQRNMRKLMKKLEGMEGKKYAIINTHAMKRSCLHKMEKILSRKKMVKIAEIDFKVGKGASTGNGLIEGWKNKVEDFASKL
ncbi:MAG: flavodoxin domain-containing protein [Candidatus Thermoplasmatota archaeon]